MYAKKVKQFSSACAKLPVTSKKLDPEKIDFIIQMLCDEMEELRQSRTLTDQVDAFADMIYYILDHCHKMGVDMDPIFNIVHLANMRKVVGGRVIRREDGKILKPENWKPPEPEIEQELERQRKLGDHR